MSDLLIRPVAVDERGRVSSLIRSVIRGCTYYPEQARETMAGHYVDMAWWLDPDPESIMAAFDGEEPVGFVTTNLHNDVLTVYWVGVATDRRRQGLGTQLFAAAVDLARRGGACSVQAHILAQNMASLTAAVGAGFTVAARLPRYWWGLSWVLMVHHLGKG